MKKFSKARFMQPGPLHGGPTFEPPRKLAKSRKCGMVNYVNVFFSARPSCLCVFTLNAPAHSAALHFGLQLEPQNGRGCNFIREPTTQSGAKCWQF